MERTSETSSAYWMDSNTPSLAQHAMDPLVKLDPLLLCARNWEERTFGDRFCILDSGTYSVIGPTCSGSTCNTGSLDSVCNSIGGKNIGDYFCVVEGKRYSTIGPTCWDGTCYTGEAQAVCDSIGGRNIGDTFCVLEGEWSAVGPVCYGNTCYTSDTQTACSAAGGRTIGDRFCILRGTYSIVGPTCRDNTCAQGETNFACSQIEGGINFADIFCAIPRSDVPGGSGSGFLSVLAAITTAFFVALVF